MVNMSLRKLTDVQLVHHCLVVRDPLTTTDPEVELLSRFQQLTGITLKDAFLCSTNKEGNQYVP